MNEIFRRLKTSGSPFTHRGETQNGPTKSKIMESLSQGYKAQSMRRAVPSLSEDERGDSSSTRVRAGNEATEAAVLTDEVLLLVLRYLSPEELFRCRAVCRGWLSLAMDPSLWRDRSINTLFDRVLAANVLRHAPCLGSVVMQDFGWDSILWGALITTSCAISGLHFSFNAEDVLQVALAISRQAFLGRLTDLSLDREVLKHPRSHQSMSPFSERSLCALLLNICNIRGLEYLHISPLHCPSLIPPLPDLLVAVPVPASLKNLKWSDDKLNPFLSLLLEWHAATLEVVSVTADDPRLAPLLSSLPRLRSLCCGLLVGMAALLQCPSLQSLEVDFDNDVDTRPRLAGFSSYLLSAAARLEHLKLAFNQNPSEEALDLVLCLGGSQGEGRAALRSLTLSHHFDAQPTALLQRLAAVMPRLLNLTKLDVGGVPSAAFLESLAHTHCVAVLPGLLELVVSAPLECAHQWAHSQQLHDVMRGKPRLHVVVRDLPGCYDRYCHFCASHKCHQCIAYWCVIFTHPKEARCELTHQDAADDGQVVDEIDIKWG
ncbi:uncharacterized protein LOC117642468 [Thrips palmi]|uniref:Uncharacterized protein LOC117642468 n=1 Tax=Thrips palmi TaxID=161013 RepID=A0A6P8YAC7_THRPL|nr:uncharacterized protein LOC117642468 [Thrips palmi]